MYYMLWLFFTYNTRFTFYSFIIKTNIDFIFYLWFYRITQ